MPFLKSSFCPVLAKQRDTSRFARPKSLFRSIALANVTLAAVALTVPVASAKQQMLLEEIIITARKKAESLQDTPISVAAFTGAGLEQRGLADVSGVGELTPNMVFNNDAYGIAEGVYARPKQWYLSVKRYF